MNIIVAIDEQNAIGKQGDLLCHLFADLKHFKSLTTGHTVVMGSRTYLSLPRRPLPNRRNIVLTRRSAALFEGAEVVRSIEEILNLNITSTPNTLTIPNTLTTPKSLTTPIIPDNEIFIIGGGQVYEQLLPYTDRLYITRLHHTFPDADTFFPAFNLTDWHLVSRESFLADEKNPYDYDFLEYCRM